MGRWKFHTISNYEDGRVTTFGEVTASDMEAAVRSTDRMLQERHGFTDPDTVVYGPDLDADTPNSARGRGTDCAYSRREA